MMESPARRRFAGGLALAPLLSAAGGGLLFALPSQAASVYRARRLLMGTWVDIQVTDGEQAGVAEAVVLAFDEMARLAVMMSRYETGNALAALEEGAGRQPVQVPREMMQVLLAARRVSHVSGGAFDICLGRLTPGPGGYVGDDIPDDNTVREVLRMIKDRRLELDPSQGTAYISDRRVKLDLGGIAKLPILAAGMNTLESHGISGVMFNGGGDVLASRRSDGQDWRIGLRDPARPDRLLAVLPLRAGVVASSGDYERFVMHQGRRYHHIVDPATGRPTVGVHGVTLVGEQHAEVNGLGTAAMVAGAVRGPALLRRCRVAQALLVGSDGAAWISPALGRRLLPPPGQDHVRSLG